MTVAAWHGCLRTNHPDCCIHICFSFFFQVHFCYSTTFRPGIITASFWSFSVFSVDEDISRNSKEIILLSCVDASQCICTTQLLDSFHLVEKAYAGLLGLLKNLLEHSWGNLYDIWFRRGMRGAERRCRGCLSFVSDLKDLFMWSHRIPSCLLRVIRRQINKDSGYVMPV